jgi:hypothetical protein
MELTREIPTAKHLDLQLAKRWVCLRVNLMDGLKEAMSGTNLACAMATLLGYHLGPVRGVLTAPKTGDSTAEN